MRLGTLGPVEMILIVLAIVLIFGASKLGDIGGAVGKSIKEFKKASRDEEAEAAAAAASNASKPPVEATQTPVAANGAAPAPQQSEAVAVGDFRPPDNKTN
jgi:sec-independent protein translocase protein TatA